MGNKETVFGILAGKSGKSVDKIDEEDVLHEELGLSPSEFEEVCDEIEEALDVTISEKKRSEEFIEVGDILRFLEEAGT